MLLDTILFISPLMACNIRANLGEQWNAIQRSPSTARVTRGCWADGAGPGTESSKDKSNRVWKWLWRTSCCSAQFLSRQRGDKLKAKVIYRFNSKPFSHGRPIIQASEAYKSVTGIFFTNATRIQYIQLFLKRTPSGSAPTVRLLGKLVTIEWLKQRQGRDKCQVSILKRCRSSFCLIEVSVKKELTVIP